MLLHISTLGVPPSVKLIDIMRTDPLKRFVVNGDGNALRVTKKVQIIEKFHKIKTHHYYFLVGEKMK